MRGSITGKREQWGGVQVLNKLWSTIRGVSGWGRWRTESLGSSSRDSGQERSSMHMLKSPRVRT